MTATSRFDAWARRNEVIERTAALEPWQAACDEALADLRALRKKYRDRGQLPKAQGVERAIALVSRVKRDERKKAASVC